MDELQNVIKMCLGWIFVGGDVSVKWYQSLWVISYTCNICVSILWLVRNFCGFTTGCWSTDPPHIAVHQGWVTQWPRQQSWKLNRRPSHVRCLGRCWCFMLIYSYRYYNIYVYTCFHRFLFAFPCCSILPCAICSLGKLWSHHYSGMKVVNAREEFSRFVWLGDLLKTYAYALPVDCVSPTFDRHDCGLDQDLDDMCVKTSNEVSLACTWWRVIRVMINQHAKWCKCLQGNSAATKKLDKFLTNLEERWVDWPCLKPWEYQMGTSKMTRIPFTWICGGNPPYSMPQW